MEIVNTTALISINETLVFQVISFLIFLFIINRIMFRPLRQVMGERTAHIEQINRDIYDAEDEIERLARSIEEQRSAVQLEGETIAKELESAGTKAAGEILEEIKAEIDQLKRNKAKELDRKIIEVRQHLEDESEVLAVHIMEKIVDRRLVQ
jgi:F-type H+-transporting ATPase subunit b